MCGIVGFYGKENAKEVVLKGLEALEYRGYDSSGITILGKGKMLTSKKVGRLSNLRSILESDPFDGEIAIGHTRWATHGAPSDLNSHPHLDMSENISVVHNGIIENYSELREELLHQEVTFKSETDTEVIPNLIAKEFTGNLLKATIKATDKLNGSYAICVVSKVCPNELVATRNDSPLVLGIDKDNNYYIASDIPAILDYTRTVFFLENKDLIHIKNGILKVYRNNVEITPTFTHITWDKDAASKDGYDSYMYKEILQQKEVILKALKQRLNKNLDLDFSDFNININFLLSLRNIYIVGCGTAYNAGLLGKYALEKYAGIPVNNEIASEFRYNCPFVNNRSLVILMSQSGETADTIAVLRKVKTLGAKTLAITNVVGSTISRESDYVFYTMAGPEIAVASTKAYTSQIIALYGIALHFGLITDYIKREVYTNKITELLSLPEKINNIINRENEIKKLCLHISEKNSCFFIGRGENYYSALEGALKLKEISYIHCEAFPAGELKHGTIALIEEGTPVIGISTVNRLYKKTLSNLQEVKARGANIFIIASADENDFSNLSDNIFYLPESDDLGNGILSVIPMQLLAYYTALELGLNIDKPRNLAKSVTVE